MASTLEQKKKVLCRVKPINGKIIQAYCNEKYSRFINSGLKLVYDECVKEYAHKEENKQTTFAAQEQMFDELLSWFYNMRNHVIKVCAEHPEKKESLLAKIVMDDLLEPENWHEDRKRAFFELDHKQVSYVSKFNRFTELLNHIKYEYEKFGYDGSQCPVITESGQRVYIENQGGDFIHVRTTSKTREKQQTECRLYLNLKFENILPVAKAVMEIAQKRGLPMHYKFSTGGIMRSDALLFYCSYEEADELIDIINEVKAANAKLFEGAENIPPFMGSIDGYIGFAEEPEKNDAKERSHTSRIVAYINECMQVQKAYRDGMITEEEYKKKRNELCEKYKVPQKSRYWFLNKSTVEELVNDGFEFEN